MYFVLIVLNLCVRFSMNIALIRLIKAQEVKPH